MSAPDPRAIGVALAIKQSFEINAGPGSSVNTHPNAFFLNISGAVDLLKAAELVLKRLGEWEAAAAKVATQDIGK